MKPLFCINCAKKLCYIKGGRIEIKCPRCKYVTCQNAESVQSGKRNNEKTSHHPA
ncbi:Com family DNA-binding transcriptional regulator [Photobacterium carnosum]|uniref:Com family DNA-binding transcriptional regulator n=1 Tax=Photobacterium carnosum TaxID=2023717 RepID=UPI0039F6C290|nr:Com family DNA-binding transcriptional regulator [Photobacterium carnosum]